MKKLFQKRLPWFLVGVVTLPLISFVRGLLEPLSAKNAMPFEFVREETTRTFRGDADYSYTLRSRGSRDEFLLFVKKMKMEENRVSDDRYEMKTERGRLLTTITYVDGWITYEEIFT